MNIIRHIICRYRVANETYRKELTTHGRPPSSEWFHIVWTIPDPREKITVFHDKIIQSGSPDSKPVYPGIRSGTTVIGKRYTDADDDYGTVTVDELILWNRTLTETEVGQLYDMYID